MINNFALIIIHKLFNNKFIEQTYIVLIINAMKFYGGI